jgi:hypothetical protein
VTPRRDKVIFVRSKTHVLNFPHSIKNPAFLLHRFVVLGKGKGKGSFLNVPCRRGGGIVSTPFTLNSDAG